MTKTEIAKVKNHIKGLRLQEPSRQRNLAYKRFYLAQYLCSKGYDYPFIGEILNRNRLTVYNAILKYDILKNDAEFKRLVQDEMEKFPIKQHYTDKKIEVYLSEESKRKLDFYVANKENVDYSSVINVLIKSIK